MLTTHNTLSLTRLTAWTGALAVLATGADHLDEYAANGFSSVPTIGTLFLLNFVASLAIAAGLLVPIGRLGPATTRRIRMLSAGAGIGLAASSLIALWISETSSLFGFADHGTRPAIVAAIVAESVAVLALTAYVALSRSHGPRRDALPRPPLPAAAPR